MTTNPNSDYNFLWATDRRIEPIGINDGPLARAIVVTRTLGEHLGDMPAYVRAGIIELLGELALRIAEERDAAD